MKIICRVNRDEQRLIEQAMKKLRSQIDKLEKSGTPFERIFNNDSIKYDVLGKGFYTFKFHGRDNAQARLLYRFIRDEKTGTYELECHRLAVKRRSGKEYMSEFASYVDAF